MLSDVNFTITITDSMGIVNRTIDIVANNCISNTMTCGEYLTEFNYANVDELEKNEAYNVSITTSIDETNNVHVLLTPVVSIIANTTIPGKVLLIILLSHSLSMLLVCVLVIYSAW